jgi:hypothetical protein
MTIIAKNVSAGDLSFLNITLPAGEEEELTAIYTTEQISRDEALQDFITAGDIVINDGVSDLPPAEGIVQTNPVKTVNGKVGDVVIDPDDLDDTLTTNKFFDDVSATKLAGIQENADVTDAVNVEAAGAVMEIDISTAAMQFVINDPTFTAALEDNLNSASATKEYIDTSIAAEIVGSNNYKGGYNASTNTPDLQAPVAGAVKLGHVYDVTVAGTFTPAGGGGIHELETGDTLRAKVDDPSLKTDWVVVQSNLTSASIKTRYESNADTNAFTDAEQAKLAGIEPNATGDQTDLEIKTAYENNADTNAFTDSEKSKLLEK